MRRRESLLLLSGIAVVWPLLAHAAESLAPRLVGVLMGFDNDEPSRALVGEFRGALAKAGWKEGGNLRIELRWGGGDVDRIGAAARELVALRPDAILAQTTPVATAPLPLLEPRRSAGPRATNACRARRRGGLQRQPAWL